MGMYEDNKIHDKWHKIDLFQVYARPSNCVLEVSWERKMCRDMFLMMMRTMLIKKGPRDLCYLPYIRLTSLIGWKWVTFSLHITTMIYLSSTRMIEDRHICLKWHFFLYLACHWLLCQQACYFEVNNVQVSKGNLCIVCPIITLFITKCEPWSNELLHCFYKNLLFSPSKNVTYVILNYGGLHDYINLRVIISNTVAN